VVDTAPRLGREIIAMRVAAEIPAGAFVNLGIGMPTLVADYVPRDKGIMIHSENGLLGTGPFPEAGHEIPELVNAGGQAVTLVPGAAFMDSAQSFSIVRGGYLDVAVLGGLQVSERGDLANWRLANRRAGSIGGAADIAAGAKRLFVAMEHTTRDGHPKILRECTYPLTGAQCVDMVFTDLAVIRVTAEGLELLETAPGWSPDDVQSLTDATLRVSPDVREVSL
jgi:3-oxoacid CoA-transferase subunit B